MAKRETLAKTGSSPVVKKGRGDQAPGSDMSDDDVQIVKVEGMPSWAMAMQTTLMQHTTSTVANLQLEVDEAKAMAMECQENIRELRKEIATLKITSKETPSLKTVQQLETDFAKLRNNTLGTASGNRAAAGGNNSGRNDEDKRIRTISFGEFPKDTKSKDIKTFIEGVVGSGADIDECFAYGRQHAERGAARFTSKDAMWKYMKDNKGKHQHMYGDTPISCNVDSSWEDPESEQSLKERAVRKVVCTIIEVNGGDAQQVKAKIDARYKKGVVLWEDCRVAEWDRTGNKMVLLGNGVAWQAHFDKLINKE